MGRRGVLVFKSVVVYAGIHCSRSLPNADFPVSGPHEFRHYDYILANWRFGAETNRRGGILHYFRSGGRVERTGPGKKRDRLAATPFLYGQDEGDEKDSGITRSCREDTSRTW